MGMDVNKAGSDNATTCINDDIALQVRSDFDDTVAFDQNIGEEARIACSVDN
jgi:hypothetical protein